jgi:hypothetical protein
VAESPSGKKVVRVEHTAAAEAEDRAARSGDGGSGDGGSATTFTPSPQAKRQALVQRIIAIVAWVLAIGAEAFAIFFVLRQNPVNVVLLIILIVVIGVFAAVGDILWKRANRADPASRENAVRFFVQNQLGAIVTVVAFLPLIILILLNKNMSPAQKGIAGGIAGVLLVVVALVFGVTYNSPSTQQYDSETQAVVNITGQDLVFWTKSGSVYHLCEQASAVNQTSKDNTIYSGTVGDAHAAGKSRLTKQVDLEEKQCGFTPATPAASATP